MSNGHFPNSLRSKYYDKFHNNERQQTRWDAEYHNKQIDEFIECKSPRTIDVFEPGEVIFSEIS